ncbi:FtsB family cell division protein [Alistipes provencensis]|uniref:FtsB family cell division protein n=1 Tax=Alistipes provencensis TaxID=1816676 RepID=UPI0007ED0696|nr:septum formation initiator family protein [Alistipes provencensis]
MKIQFGRKFWIVATAAIVVFTVFMVGRNALHAVKIKRQINVLTRERAYYSEKIEQDSTLLERLRYDDFLEEYARENYHMQRRDEHVYIIKE